MSISPLPASASRRGLVGAAGRRPHRARTVLLPDADRHLVSRFGYGIDQDLAHDVVRHGGAARWFARQLRPDGVRESSAARQVDHWWPSLKRGPAELWQRQITQVESGYEVMNDYARWVLMRRMTSNRQVLETMTEFWENHLHVAAVGDAQFTHRADYGRTIRRHALGRFDQLLGACAVHPAMLIFLDAYTSTKDHPNENLGRELLELHTVGAGNYTERDVRDSARILTGWTVDAWKTWKPDYEKDDHYVGRVRVKGFADANRNAHGQAVTHRYLHHLAHHPDTARRIAGKLVVKFVGDDVDGAAGRRLVGRLARVYLDADTAIVPVLEELVASPAFRRGATAGSGGLGSKVRDPGEDVVATYRVMGAHIAPPSAPADDSPTALDALVWQTGNIGVVPFSWARPDGQPIDSDSWSAPARLLASMSFHSDAAGGWPDHGVIWREPKDWLPGRHVAFDDLVDHLARTLLHRPAGPRLVTACCQATGLKRHELVEPDSDLVKYGFGRLLTTLLDSPDHLSR